MFRIIPPHTKTKTTIVMGLTLFDLLYIAIWLLIAMLLIALRLEVLTTFICLGIIGVIVSVSLMSVGNIKGYQFLGKMFLFFTRKHKHESVSLKYHCNVAFDKNTVIDAASGIKSKVIEIQGIDFGILTEDVQDMIISRFSKSIKMVQAGKIIKLDKPLDLSGYINRYEDRYNELRREYEKLLESGEEITQSVKNYYDSRCDILLNNINRFTYKTNSSPIYIETFYLVIYDMNEDNLEWTANNIADNFQTDKVQAHVLDKDGIIEFYELYYDAEMNDNGDLTIPPVVEKFNSVEVNSKRYRMMTLGKLPMYSINAWLNSVFRPLGTKVCLNFVKNKDNRKVGKSIEKARIELETRYSDKRCRDDEKKIIERQLASLDALLEDITDGEALYNTSFYIMYPLEEHKEWEERFHNAQLGTDKLLYQQMESYLAMNPYSPEVAEVKSAEKQWPSLTLAGTFPFVSKVFLDPQGNWMGVDSQSGHEVFFDLFYSWPSHKKIDESRSRVNANMMILGKSGGGKSYFVKKLMMQLLCDNVKIYILDPENEYQYMCNKFGGNMIDAGGIIAGTINPMQIFPSGDVDSSLIEGGGQAAVHNELAGHIQFLQQWFKVVGVGLDEILSATLNGIVQEVYYEYGITEKTDINTLTNEDFPVLNDVYVKCKSKMESMPINSREREDLRKLTILLKDFSNGGIHAGMWNGVTTLELTNDFTVINFQSLIANENTNVANGQMLLLMRFLMQEVIKNKNLNEKQGLDKNVVIAVDEAHVFIDEKQPYALSFMQQMAKRVRKYGGSLLVGTQNLKDFIGGNPNTVKLASAVINACQYSMLFGLAPNDVEAMIELYKNSGGLNKEETRILTNSERGQALMIVDPRTRASLTIKAIKTPLNEEHYFLAAPKPSDI